MSTKVSTAANTTHHPEHLGDRAAMAALRAIIALQPATRETLDITGEFLRSNLGR